MLSKLTAVPDAGWDFQNWTGDASGSQNPVQVTVGATTSVTAVFAESLTITTSALPNGTIGQPYNSQLQAAGGSAPLNWSVVAGSGSLPGGLSLDPCDGRDQWDADRRRTCLPLPHG